MTTTPNGLIGGAMQYAADAFLDLRAKASMRFYRLPRYCAAAMAAHLRQRDDQPRRSAAFRAATSAALLGLLAPLALTVAAVPAAAANVVFPPGSHLGLVPPPGMKPSTAFPGFEDAGQHAAIIMKALPQAAFATLQQPEAVNALKKDGIIVEKREPLKLAVGNAVLLVGTQVGPDNVRYRKWLLAAQAGNVTAIVNVQVPEQSTTYSDAIVRAALATLAVRQSVPQSELLKLVPFSIGNLAGYHVDRVIPGRGVFLSDGPKIPRLIATDGIPKVKLGTRVMIAALPGGPPSKAARATFARTAFDTIVGLKNVQITMSEPVRLADHEAFETVAHATDVGSGGDVVVVQWLRFGRGGFLQFVGISPATAWSDELTRLRAMRDSINLK
jgi:hypothetical protein